MRYGGTYHKLIYMSSIVLCSVALCGACFGLVSSNTVQYCMACVMICITVQLCSIARKVHLLGTAFPNRQPSTFVTGTFSKLTNSAVPEAISSERFDSNEITNGPCDVWKWKSDCSNRSNVTPCKIWDLILNLWLLIGGEVSYFFSLILRVATMVKHVIRLST